jgi:capsular polysaccharide biosynthesis protein
MQEISLSQLLKLIRKNIILILLCAIIGFVGAFSISKFLIPKTYVSTVKLYVSAPETSQNSTSDINALNYAQKVVNTYIEMLQTNSFYQKVIDECKLNYSIEDFKKQVAFSSLNDTEVFQAQVSVHDPNEAKTIADAITKLAPTTISQLKENASLKVVDSATLPDKPSSPNTILNSIIGLILGIACSVIFVLLRDVLDVRIKSEDDILEKYNIPILASIPAFNMQVTKTYQSSRR